MNSLRSHLINIQQKTTAGSLSKAQKLFNKLTKKIGEQRHLLQAWQTEIPLYQQKHASEFIPLFDSFDESRSKMVIWFDQACHEKQLSKTDRNKLSYLICEIAGDLLSNRDNPELKAIFNQHAEDDFDQQGESMKAGVKTLMEDMFGMEIDEDIDFDDPQAMLEMMAEQARLADEREQQVRQAKAGKRKKSAKQIAKEALQEEQEKKVSLSIREVYRKLASALHPDREQDPAEQRRKTDLMQRVNIAYGNKDLLRLLELQLEIEQIDEHAINSISEERLQHYNQVLQEQAGELEVEIGQTEMAFCLRFGIHAQHTLKPSELLIRLKKDIAHIKTSITQIEHDLRELKDIKKLKLWLKSYRIPPAHEFDDPLFDELF